jgi:disulfide bond formation protein DsbB
MMDLSLRTFSAAALTALAFALTLATILGAWAFELIGGYQPCPLCLTQRNPYYVALPLLGLGWFMAARGGARSLAAGALALACIVFIVGAGYGAYHSGVEWGWWPGPASCATAAGGAAGSVGDLLSQLETVRVVACDEVQWRFLGLTFANYNVLVSLTVAGLAGLAALRAYGSSSVSQ